MATKYEMSKTYQYRKVMKPLLERKRRARINKCLDDLKDLLAEVMQQNRSSESDDCSAKFEKADILELTVQHLRKLKDQKKHHISNKGQHSFRNGYIQAANEVSRCLATLPKVNVEFGTRLMTHLGLRLNQLESSQQEELRTPLRPSNYFAPLSINCNTIPVNVFVSSSTTHPPLCSPVSSGYASDYENSRQSPAVSLPQTTNHSKGLLQVAAPVWRPW